MMLCFLFATLIVALDQFFKQWVIKTIEFGELGPDLLPGFLGLTHWENDGAMLNFLSGQQWLLAGIAFVVSVVLIMILLRYNEGFWGTLALSSVLGGTVGNLFDRIFNEGKVIDMFMLYTTTQTGGKQAWFPIFNIADIFITLGFITFLIHFIALTFKQESKDISAGAGNADASEDFDLSSLKDNSGADDPAPVNAVSGSVLDDIVAGYDGASESAADISLAMAALEAELGPLDLNYDVEELLREYGIEENDNQ